MTLKEDSYKLEILRIKCFNFNLITPNVFFHQPNKTKYIYKGSYSIIIKNLIKNIR